MSPYIAGVGVCFLTHYRVDLINFRCIFSKSITLSPVYHIELAYSNMSSIGQSKTLNAIVGDNFPTTGRDCLCREKNCFSSLGSETKERFFQYILRIFRAIYNPKVFIFFSYFYYVITIVEIVTC